TPIAATACQRRRPSNPWRAGGRTMAGATTSDSHASTSMGSLAEVVGTGTGTRSGRPTARLGSGVSGPSERLACWAQKLSPFGSVERLHGSPRAVNAAQDGRPTLGCAAPFVAPASPGRRGTEWSLSIVARLRSYLRGLAGPRRAFWLPSPYRRPRDTLEELHAGPGRGEPQRSGVVATRSYSEMSMY